MFLALTSNQKFWKKDEKILFLGEWCRRYNHKNIWELLDHEVLPYHWNDRGKLYADYTYLDALYEKYLPLLAHQLNTTHKTFFSNRYWRILIGPWLKQFLGVFYDRYLSINSAIKSENASHTWLPIWPADNFIPLDFETYQNWVCSDEYNHYIYGWLIRNLTGINYETKKNIFCELPKTNNNSYRSCGFLKNLTKGFFEYYFRLTPESFKEVVFVSSYLTTWQLLRLQVSLGQAPSPCSPRVFTTEESVDRRLREQIELPHTDDQFESLLTKIVPTQVPKVYLECYSSFRQKSLKYFPKKTQVIVTTNGLYGNEGFKFWAAEILENTGKLIGGQHGGTYGSALWLGNESHETKVSDRYFTWGWGDQTDPKLVALPVAQLIKLKNIIKPNPNGCILWPAMSSPLYFYRMFSMPLGPSYVFYRHDQERFAYLVNREVYELLMLRLYSENYGWDEENRWRAIEPNLQTYKGKKSIFQQLSDCRLCVSTYNSTTFLETFSANYPTIIFWNPKYFELRKSAQPYYDFLRNAEILHDSPESAAAKVNDIYRDPMAWWLSIEVQEAKNRFCQKFALTNRQWFSDWKEEINLLKRG
jgi:putative transferase (TIGR04331 family)